MKKAPPNLDVHWKKSRQRELRAQMKPVMAWSLSGKF
ncbi:hypothetical protein IWX85_001513 [Polaromonas sp. CG_9.11]|nr:hypothetical protein [Polaromonas sp. CG_9.11]